MTSETWPNLKIAVSQESIGQDEQFNGFRVSILTFVKRISVAKSFESCKGQR